MRGEIRARGDRKEMDADDRRPRPTGRSTCKGNQATGRQGCGATYSGRMLHCVAPAPWSTHADGLCHETFGGEVACAMHLGAGWHVNPRTVSRLRQGEGGTWHQNVGYGAVETPIQGPPGVDRVGDSGAAPRGAETVHPGVGFAVGDRVVIERDETRWPSRGTWPRYRGRRGTVVVPDNYGEVGVAFGAGTTTDAWFKPHELRPV